MSPKKEKSVVRSSNPLTPLAVHAMRTRSGGKRRNPESVSKTSSKKSRLNDEPATSRVAPEPKPSCSSSKQESSAVKTEEEIDSPPLLTQQIGAEANAGRKPEVPIKSEPPLLTQQVEVGDEGGENVKPMRSGLLSYSDGDVQLSPEFDNLDPDTVFYTKCIKKALGEHYFRIEDRLSLGYTPECLKRMEQCLMTHTVNSKRLWWTTEYMECDVKTFIAEERPLHFVKMIWDMTLRYSFPGETLIQHLLQLILTINEVKENEDYSADEVVKQGIMVFYRIMTAFSPCAAEMRRPYMQMLRLKLEIGNINRTNYNLEDGIFALLLSMLEYNLQLKQDEEAEEGGGNDSVRMSMDLSFHEWEQLNKQNYDFDRLSREKRFERIFMVLKLVVNLLETDMAVWMMKNPREVRSNVKSAVNRPLIAGLIWADEGSNGSSTNLIIKRVVNVFLTCIHLKFPDEDIHALGRIVNLIAIVINLSEFQYKEEERGIDYPCIKEESLCFARYIKKLIEESPHFSFPFYLAVLKYIRTPYLQLIISNEVLNRLNPKDASLTIKKILTEFFNCAFWKQFPQDDCVRSQKPTDEAPTTKYPYHNPDNDPPDVGTLTDRQFLDLCLIYLRGYVKIYRLNEVLQLYSSPDKRLPKTFFPPPKPLPKLNWDNLEEQLANVDLEKLLKEKIPPRVEAPRPILNEIIITRDLALVYRSDIKFLLFVKRICLDRGKMEPELFEKLNRFFVEEMGLCEAMN